MKLLAIFLLTNIIGLLPNLICTNEIPSSCMPFLSFICK